LSRVVSPERAKSWGWRSSRLKELTAAGKVRPVIDRRYPLSEIVDALKWVNDGHARGKVVITFPV
jgi:NADPH:quinone reductase-like Zn-dependent oxidoreductase